MESTNCVEDGKGLMMETAPSKQLKDTPTEGEGKEDDIMFKGDAEEEEGEHEEERLSWGTRFDFLLSTIGFAVDLANVWRFPYLCFKNGGGAFLIPYFTMLVCGALPLFFLELLLGQYQQTGVISIWRIAPIFKGLGWCACLISFYVAWYYNVVIAWSIYYFIQSFTGTPWTTCGNEWNTDQCWDAYAPNTTAGNYTGNFTEVLEVATNVTNTTLRISPAAEYFERHVLNLYKSTGIGDLGSLSGTITGCTLLVFVILYFSLWKGIKSMGKAVWVTATMPYIVLLVLLIRGLMLEGAVEGIAYFIVPRMERLHEQQVWIDAAVQIFYSVGAGFGVHIAYSSYNPKNNNCHRDCIVACLVNSFTSIFSGFVVFSYLGYMAASKHMKIKDVVAEGPGLVFVVYPEAIATIPGSVFWALLFFLMLLTLGLDSSFGGLEAILTGLKDEFKDLFQRYKWSREIATAILCFVAFLFALMNASHGGMYMVTLMDTYSAGISILFVALSQAICVSWVYGMDQFCEDAKSMLGFYPGFYWRFCWKFLSPIFLTTIVIWSLTSHSHLTLDLSTGTYTYPEWSDSIAWFLTSSSLILIPIFAIYAVITAKGNTFRLKIAHCITPVSEHPDIEKGIIKRFKLAHWLSFGPKEGLIPCVSCCVRCRGDVGDETAHPNITGEAQHMSYV
ncbi:sodium-dependent noradrenaline transporter-like [Lineus longissimus]|uniref:sodium-dependent noradrenaline transporter-like n=1 Tax=Lineus longissimus TaxID=88925 RepID=UPI002B4F1A45